MFFCHHGVFIAEILINRRLEIPGTRVFTQQSSEMLPLLAGELHFTDCETSHTSRLKLCFGLEQILLVFLFSIKKKSFKVISFIKAIKWKGPWGEC